MRLCYSVKLGTSDKEAIFSNKEDTSLGGGNCSTVHEMTLECGDTFTDHWGGLSR